MLWQPAISACTLFLFTINSETNVYGVCRHDNAHKTWTRRRKQRTLNLVCALRLAKCILNYLAVNNSFVKFIKINICVKETLLLDAEQFFCFSFSLLFVIRFEGFVTGCCFFSIQVNFNASGKYRFSPNRKTNSKKTKQTKSRKNS